MNTERSDFDRALSSWFGDGPTAMSDRVVDAIAERIAREPQRRSWRIRGRSFMRINTQLAAGTAAAALVAIVGWQLATKTPLGVGPSAEPSASTALAASDLPALPDGSLAPGTYRVNPLVSDPSLRIAATVPRGWSGFGSFAILGPRGPGSPGGIGIAFIATTGLYADPCHWDLNGDRSWPQAADVAVGPTVDDLVRALSKNKSYTSTTAVDTTLGGFTGKALELQLPADIGSCDKDLGGSSRFMVFSGLDGGLYAQGPANRFHVTIVDVAGTRLVAVLVDYEATPDADRNAAQKILESLVITP